MNIVNKCIKNQFEKDIKSGDIVEIVGYNAKEDEIEQLTYKIGNQTRIIDECDIKHFCIDVDIPLNERHLLSGMICGCSYKYKKINK